MEVMAASESLMMRVYMATGKGWSAGVGEVLLSQTNSTEVLKVMFEVRVQVSEACEQLMRTSMAVGVPRRFV